MTPLLTLCEIIAQGTKVSKSAYVRRDGFDVLLARGFVQEKGVVQSLVCDSCDRPHDAEIVFRDGCYGYLCPDIGFVPVADAQRSAIVADVQLLIAKLSELFKCNRRKSTSIHGQTWRIGSVKTHDGDLTIFFHPCLQSTGDARDLDSALRDELSSPYRLVLTASGTMPFPNIVTAHLTDVVSLDLASGAMRELAYVNALVGAPEFPTDGRPNEFRDPLHQIFSARKDGGASLPGRNKEADAILHEFSRLHPSARAPALSVVRRYVTEFRRGS